MCKLTLLIAVVSLMAVSSLANLFNLSGQWDRQWTSYKKRYNKVYNGPEEESIRELIFKDNCQKIEYHNILHGKGLKTFKVAINQFADMTLPEYRKMMLGYKPSTLKHSPLTFTQKRGNITGLPKQINWVKKGYVTGVKNQGQCGSCWSFSVTGATEGAHFKQTGKLVSLSEQNLIDCASAYGTHGCDGGTMEDGFKYIIEEGGVDTEKSYPYLGKEEKECYSEVLGAKLTSYKDVEPVGDESVLQATVAKVGPISGAIDAGKDSFQFYKSGVYNEPDCSSTEVNHAILIVGYGVEDGQDYWLVKNSYGADWGDKGYIKMSRNVDNQCGIATQTSYPIA